MVHGAPVYRLRGRLLPLVYLSRTLKTQADDGIGKPVLAANFWTSRRREINTTNGWAGYRMSWRERPP